MSDARRSEHIHSTFWLEESEHDNPFAAAACYCAGYDVYGHVLEHAGWPQYLLLLLTGEIPAPRHAALFERLAIALANAGPRDPAVAAAMNGGATGTPAAAWLSSALAVGAGRLGGAREIHDAMTIWRHAGTDIAAWNRALAEPLNDVAGDVWPPADHVPGFDPHGTTCTAPVRRTLSLLAGHSDGDALRWLERERGSLERLAGCPLAMPGVAAAALHDLGLAPAAGEVLYLFLRLPGAMAHALEQNALGHTRYPFYADGLDLQDDPGE